MSVIINDFEVVLDRPAGGDGASGGQSPAQPAPTPSPPVDLRALMRREEVRIERLKAD